MGRHARPLAWRARIASMLMVASLALLVSAAPVAAECVQFDEWPSFRELAPGSTGIVVGRVEAALSEDSADNAIGFRLQVEEVLRGSAVSTLEFEGVRPPGPLECRDSVLRVHVGDVVALAFDTPSGDTVRAVAFVEGRPDRDFLPGIEKLTLTEVRRLASELPPTDTVAEGKPTDEVMSGVPTLAGILALPVHLAMLGRR